MSAPTGPAAHTATEADFLDLLLADDEFVRAEFDAIVSAGWPALPPRRIARRPWSPGPAAPPRLALPVRPLPTLRPWPGPAGWARQRAPP
jgi:hypothetical protein